MNTLEMSQIVDDQDNPIGAKPRNEIDYENDYYRVSGVWLTNSINQVLIAQRSMAKDKDPGKWGPAAAGTLEAGETYESNAYKEAEEELGLTGARLVIGPKIKVTYPRKYFSQCFIATCDWPEERFILQPTEVDQVKRINKDELFEDVRKNSDRYLPTMSIILNSLYP